MVILHCESCVEKSRVEEMGLLVPCLCEADGMRCDNWVPVSALAAQGVSCKNTYGASRQVAASAAELPNQPLSTSALNETRS